MFRSIWCCLVVLLAFNDFDCIDWFWCCYFIVWGGLVLILVLLDCLFVVSLCFCYVGLGLLFNSVVLYVTLDMICFIRLGY